MDTEGQIALLLEKIENLRIQQGRLMSHVDSEQRHTVRHGKDIDKLTMKLEALEKQNEKHDNNWKFWIAVGVSVASVLIAIYK